MQKYAFTLHLSFVPGLVATSSPSSVRNEIFVSPLYKTPTFIQLFIKAVENRMS